MDASPILVVEDDVSMLFVLDECLKGRNYATLLARDGQEALDLFAAHSPSIVLLDLKIPKIAGLDVLQKIKEKSPETIVIILTGNATINNAVEAMKKGAYDFITKPFEVDNLLSVIEKAARKWKVAYENLLAQSDGRLISPGIYFSDISCGAKKLDSFIDQIALSDSPILIEGESGTGKSLIAREIHDRSLRRGGPFVRVDCATLPSSLVESELFGYEKGAFTGASSQKQGKIERADGGTLFLDEISLLDFSAQAALLSLIQNLEFERVGGNRLHKVDMRIIAASNQNLQEMLKQKTFRQDLYYRLNVFTLVMPRLKDRAGDIIPLAYFFINKYGSRKGVSLSTEAAMKLTSYEWPGNIRELENVIKRALILMGQDPVIEISHLPLELNQGYWAFRELNLGLNEILETTEKHAIEQALVENNLNIEKCAQALKMPKRTLYYRIKKLNIDLGAMSPLKGP